MTLGEKIQTLRKQKGLSQEQLSLQMTISRQAISKWELGESMPDTDNIIHLSKLFDVSTDYLLNDDYKDDMDIPIIKVSNDISKKDIKNKVMLITSWVMIGIGGVGVLTMWLLSTVIPSLGMVPSNSPNATLGFSVGGKMNWYTSEKVYRLGDFLSNNHLEILFGLCCVTMLIGIALLYLGFTKKQKVK